MAHPAGNVGVLLDAMAKNLAQIETFYRRDLAAHAVSDELLYLVRSVIQDAQSALDWTATAVAEEVRGPADWAPYFPLVKDPLDFPSELERQIKGLSTERPAVADAFERHQPYQPGKADLGHLHTLGRVNKHRDFTPQTRVEQRRVRVESPDGGSVEWGPGVTFGGNVSVMGVPIDPNTQRPIPDPRIRVTETIYVDWLFRDPSVPVRQTLHSLASLVGAAVRDIRSSAGL